MDYEITLDDILSKDGGQAYFESVYSDIHKCFTNPHHKISLRDDDKTASAGVFKNKNNGWWMIKDFGGGGNNKAETALQTCMRVRGLNYGQAIKALGEFYGFEIKFAQASATYNNRPAGADEQPKQIKITKYKDFTQAEVLTILSPKAWEGIEWAGVDNKDDDKIRLEYALELFKYYHFKSVESYEQVSKDGTEVHIYSSNDSFPIFAFDEANADGTRFQKIYKPKDEKKYRFLWVGKKPEHYIHGLFQHKKYISSNVEANEAAHNEALENEQKPKARLPEKFKDIMLCSGGSDALNAAALGYRVIWLNSETAKIEKNDFKAIMGICYTFYNLPDIDITGKNAALELAFWYINVHTVWLPNSLLNKTDDKGNACKDLRDYLKYYSKDAFKNLVKDSLPFKFWDEQDAVNDKGEQKFRFGRPQVIYEMHHVRAYNFLQMNGFYRYPTDKSKDGYVFIKTDGNKLSKVEPNVVKNFIHSFLKERKESQDLRNVMYKTQQLSDSSLSNLEEFNPNLKHFGKDYQYISFDKTTWKVTADGIKKVKTPDFYVWNFKAIKIETTDDNGRLLSHDVSIVDDMFNITGNVKDGWDIETKNLDSDFFKFITNTCRIHWRKELEERMFFCELSPKEKTEYQLLHDLTDEQVKKLDSYNNEAKQQEYNEKYKYSVEGKLLTNDEIKEQKLALINRIFCIGYLLHRYKDSSKPWAIFLMDYRISEEGASNGRAGKGILAKALYRMLWNSKDFPSANVVVSKDGRKPDMFDYEHIWEPVERWVTDLIHIEDWSEFQDFSRLFTPLTSMLNINPKGKMISNCIYPEYGKFLIDTNFADRHTDTSSMGRKLHSIFSDYYHEDLNFYREKRTPFMELGRQIFDDWDATQWNLFYNFMAQCLKFYLSVSNQDIKIEPPFANIVKRNNLAMMGENFRQWAENYFTGKLNTDIGRTEAFEDCKSVANIQKLTAQTFWRKLQAWAEFNEYKFNPESINGWRKDSQHSKYGTIKRMIIKPNTTDWTSKEFVHIEGKESDISDIPV